MKRYGYKAVVEELKNCCYVRQNTMPFRFCTYPDIALIGFDENANEVVMGSISYPTFSKLLDYGDIKLVKEYSNFRMYY